MKPSTAAVLMLSIFTGSLISVVTGNFTPNSTSSSTPSSDPDPGSESNSDYYDFLIDMINWNFTPAPPPLFLSVSPPINGNSRFRMKLLHANINKRPSMNVRNAFWNMILFDFDDDNDKKIQRTFKVTGGPTDADSLDCRLLTSPTTKKGGVTKRVGTGPANRDEFKTVLPFGTNFNAKGITGLICSAFYFKNKDGSFGTVRIPLEIIDKQDNVDINGEAKES